MRKWHRTDMEGEFQKRKGSRGDSAAAGTRSRELASNDTGYSSAEAKDPGQPQVRLEVPLSESPGAGDGNLSSVENPREMHVAEMAGGDSESPTAESSDAQLRALVELQKQTDAHLEGALQTIRDIRSSFSYRLGRALTWPARSMHDGFLALRSGSGRLSLAAKLLLVVVKHPVQAWRMLSAELLRNLYITFVKRPGTAPEVVSYYARQFDEQETSNQILQGLAREEVGSADPEPLVSVIVVNLNGREHLPVLLQSLAKQTYRNHETVFVDNGSTDGSVEFVRAEFPKVKIVALEKNYGFAEATNIGSELASGELYCLLNNDMRVAVDCLERLVTRILRSPRIGAVSPKILFWEKFVLVELEIAGKISPPGRVLLDLKLLDGSMSLYRKRFLVSGWGAEVRAVDAHFREILGAAKLRLPVFDGQTSLSLRFNNESAEPVRMLIRSSALATESAITLAPSRASELNLDFSRGLDNPGLYYLVNNAGSDVDEQGHARDLGFGDSDDGQFDAERVLTAVCGGAVLLRKQALQGLPVFAGDFFAYFEDTDLSLRLRKAGYHLLYCPQGVAYHKHASTSEEYSPFFRFYVARNRLLFLALHYPKDFWQEELKKAKMELQHMQLYYEQHDCSPSEKTFGKRIPELFQDWDRLIKKIEQNNFYDRANLFPRLGIYDNFWTTLGGGEHHACVLADALQQFGSVDLISEEDFSLPELESQFGIDLRYCRKVLVSAPQIHHDPSTTEGYDVFVNSTYGSDLTSHCRNSYYIVSFPNRPLGGKPRSLPCAASYRRFLCNSRYTAGWLERWWGIEGEVLNPSVALPDRDVRSQDKANLILNVGRFFREGHNKKQLELVQAFKSLRDQGKLDSSWRLALVGQVHEDQKDYLHEVQREAAGYLVEIYNDAKLEDLQNLYSDAALYWHATGLNEDCSAHPELYEHFGITTVEAMSYGCIPIVIAAGGQPEIVRHGESGYLFSDEQGLIDYTALCSELKKQQVEQFNALSRSARDTAQGFSREDLKRKFIKLLRRDGIELRVNARIY